MKRHRVEKDPIDPRRVRRIPEQGFSWIDRRFVREGFLDDLPREAGALYFFLAAVSDQHGMSFYADPTVSRLLKLTAEELVHARYWLEKAELILYRAPLYQLLPLPAKLRPTRSRTTTSSPATATRAGGEAMSLREFLDALGRQPGDAPWQRRGEKS
jgi:hypothetical protein